MRRPGLALACMLAWAASAPARPVVAAYSTCAALNAGMYPADTTTWFDSQRNPQVVFYAHLLFPLFPEEAGLPGPWHPPMAWRGAGFLLSDQHYAEAVWMDPENQEIARYGLTLPARVSSDYLMLEGKQYIPHTFAMSIGTKDLRSQAGQKVLPAKAGQYHIDLKVDGELEGIAFFKMLTNGIPALGAPAQGAAAPLSGAAATVPGGEAGAVQEMMKAVMGTNKKGASEETPSVIP